MDKQLDYLDVTAARLCGNDDRTGWGVLSTGEKLYVALAANRPDLLNAINYTIAEAMQRVGDDWCRQLAHRWQYGVPERAAVAVSAMQDRQEALANRGRQ